VFGTAGSKVGDNVSCLELQEVKSETMYRFFNCRK
jgi:hypothetical protein